MSINDVENRWFPPSPHKEAVLEFLNKGRAHIEERGHNVPPLLVFEDGGVMELPKARYKNGNFSPDESSSSSRQTNYSDVCGNIDELKRLLQTQPELAKSDPARLFGFIDDVCYLLSRMQRRQEAYKSAVDSATKVIEKMQKIEGPNVNEAYEKSEILKNAINENSDKLPEKIEELFNLAEDIRDVANRMEQNVLYPFRDLFIELGEIYYQVRGSRAWENRKENK